MNCLYVRRKKSTEKSSGPKINSCGTRQFISSAFEEISSGATKDFLFERHDSNHLVD